MREILPEDNQQARRRPVISHAPIDLSRVTKIGKPTQRLRYEMQKIGQPIWQDVLMKKFGKEK